MKNFFTTAENPMRQLKVYIQKDPFVISYETDLFFQGNADLFIDQRGIRGESPQSSHLQISVSLVFWVLRITYCSTRKPCQVQPDQNSL